MKKAAIYAGFAAASLLLFISCQNILNPGDLSLGSGQGGALTLTGRVTTLAGSTAFGCVDGTGTSARFYGPIGITTDGTNLYVVDSGNNMIRRIE